MLATSAIVHAKDDGWKVPLEKKAEIFEKNVLERHWIDGLYPSSVEVPLDGSPVDQTTQGSSNIAHSVCWTSYYLGGQCHRYLFTKDEEVREHCNQIFESIYRCQLVTGKRGMQSRGYAIGHGDSYEERENSSHSNDWHQGAGEYINYRWRGSPSHHNYSSSIYAFGMYYDLVAEGEWKDRCREAIDALVSYWADDPDLIIRNYDGSIGAPILGFTDGKTPNTRIIMAAAGLRVAHHATGKQKFADLYEKLVTQYSFRTWRKDISGSRGFDDPDHVLQHLENMFRIEEDRQLREFYRHVADKLWADHVHDKQALFNYIYYGLVPDAPGKEQALEDALWTLQSYPTDKIFRPRMNSIRKDIKIADGRPEKPLPLYESPWDNEYQWKGHLYQLDGWLSRITTSIAIPEEDPMVIYATDGGYIFKTVDGGKNWREISQNLMARPRKLACGQRVRMLFVAASDGFYKTTNAGESWHRMPLPDNSGSSADILVDRVNPSILYAVTDQGIYRSQDHGEKWLGERWEELTGDELPPAERKSFHVGLGDPAIAYAILDGITFSRAVHEDEWQKGERAGISYGRAVTTYPWVAIDPGDPATLYVGIRSEYGNFPPNLLSVSRDRGKTWSVSMEKIYEKFRTGGMTALFEGRFMGGTVHDLKVDPRDSNVLYAACDEGVIKLTNAGAKWEMANNGLEIPRAHTIFALPASQKIYVGTSAGLFESSDSGEHWENSNLVLIFHSNTRREVGSADYLDAYWRGRYFGFITDEQAKAKPDEW
jgi:photosystem II stability/assembly factor-like uncharacterized protein